MSRILVIGATGRVGRQVLFQLPAMGVPVRALARNPQTADLPPLVDVVCGDLTLPETLDECLDGIGAVFPITPRSFAREANPPPWKQRFPWRTVRV